MGLEDEVRGYCYPEGLTLAPFEYKWDGFRGVWVIGILDEFETVANWYKFNLRDAWINEEEDYMIFTLMTGDIHLSDATNASGLKGLRAFFGSSVLDRFCENKSFGAVGVIRLSEP
jgi:hypothetical protein